MISVRSGHKKVSRLILLAALLFSPCTAVSFADNAAPVNSQSPNVSMTLFPVVREPNGTAYILTPRGFKINIPGLGISPEATTISVFQDPDRNYWYIDKNNCPTQVTAEQVQWAMTQINAEAAQAQSAAYSQPVPAGYPGPGGYGYATQPQQQPAPPQTVIVQQEQPQSGSSGGGSSALGTGLAAAGGAALGSVITNSIYDSAHPYYGGMPYGVPMYREASGRYYYNNGNNKVYVAPHNDTANITRQWEQQGTWNTRQNWANTNPERNFGAGNMESDLNNRVKNNEGRFQEGFRRGGGFRRR